jgi:hypothetical protein
MSLNASLRNRVRRLEARSVQAGVPSLSAIIREARAIADSESDEEAAASRVRALDEALDVLLHGPKPLSPAAVRWFPFLNDLRAQQAQRHVQEMREGGDAARCYLADVEAARGLYIPRHWPLPAEPREVQQ